jgi:hypothetical protein
MRARETDGARLSHNLGVAGDYATTLLDSLKRVQRVAQPVCDGASLVPARQ